jgi:hypothetical protein
MEEKIEFYICQICFRTGDNEEVCHKTMIPVISGDPGDKRRKPIKDKYGVYFSRAPLWFHQSTSKLNIDDIIEHRDY